VMEVKFYPNQLVHVSPFFAGFLSWANYSASQLEK
jgi:hypothetical protein